jgi:multidrug efflux system membrane fusion protein
MKKIAQKIINAPVNLFIKIKSMPAWKKIFKFVSIKIQLATQKIISLNGQLTQFAQPRLQNLIRKIIRNNEFILKTKTTQISLYIGIYLIISLLLHFINGFVEDSKNRSARMRPVSVVTSPINSGQITVIQTALGTVTPRNTVIVHSQVSGVLSKVFFREGDLVKAGQLLALIDPRPFEASLKQAEGTLSKDKALLANAQLDLKRYDTLLKQDSISHQVYATQKALVDQYKGNVLTDEGLVSNAKLQLEFAHISSPINGRVGLRNVDPGNLVQPGDANGLFAITQLQPTTVLFSVPQDVIPSFKKFLEEPPSLENFDTKSTQKVDESSQNLRNLDSTIKQKYSHRKDHANSEANSEVSANDHQTSSTQKIVIPVEAWNPDNTKKLATGYLESIDNQIDITTGTVKLRAIFPNEDMSLFPNQFVNIRVVLNVLTDVLTMPVPAIQRGTPGTFVYRLNNNNTVSVVPIKLGPIDGNNVQVIEGLAAGNIVVVDGTDKLRNGAKVIVGDPTTSSPETKRWREGAKGRASP